METNNIDDLLRNRMSEETSGIEPPEYDLVKMARQKVANRARTRAKVLDIKHLLNMRVKLYKAGIAAALLVGVTFFFAKNNEEAGERKSVQFADTLRSSSAKQNMLLVKNFTTRIN